MNLPKLNLPDIDSKIKLVGTTMQIFDNVRKKYFSLTPEEWVRQHFINYLHKVKSYPLGLMKIEHIIKYNNMNTRADIVLYNTDGVANMIVECKAPDIRINQETFYQIARYNSKLQVQFLVVTNGINHFCCEMDYLTGEIVFLNEIPFY